jgi:hypothetical protein
MGKTAIEAPRSNVFMIRWDNTDVKIHLVTDKNREDYDAGIEEPLSEEFIQGIMDEGMLQPAEGYKVAEEGDTQVIELVWGRTRWRAVQEIWKRMLDKGEDMKFAPVFKLLIAAPKTKQSAFKRRIMENTHRKVLQGVALAKELNTYLELYGRDAVAMENARQVFGFQSIVAMRNCLRLLEVADSVQETVDAGHTSPSAAVVIAAQEPEVQNQIAEAVQAEAEQTGKPVPVARVKKIVADATGKTAFKRRSLTEIACEIELWDPEGAACGEQGAFARGVASALRWMRFEKDCLTSET